MAECIAIAIDEWRKAHPEATIGDVFDALDQVARSLAEAVVRQ